MVRTKSQSARPPERLTGSKVQTIVDVRARSWVEVRLDRIRQNLGVIRAMLSPTVQVMAVVKADAYGHGAPEIARCLRQQGVDRFAVANVAEAVRIQTSVPGAQILVLGGCLPGEEHLFQAHGFIASLFNDRRLPASIPVEVKIDTGMSRLGIPCNSAGPFLASLDNPVLGIYSHLASADDDSGFSELQVARFLKAAHGLPFRRHLANSAGLRFPGAHLDMVRPGLALYGVSPHPSLTNFAPALAWKTRILCVRDVPAGEFIGYGRTFQAVEAMRIAVLPVGYADGYDRRLSNVGLVRLHGRLAPVVGRVSMDLTTVDISQMKEASAGDEVSLLENDPRSPISAAGLASMLGTIPYEILTGIGPRTARVFLEKGEAE